MKVTGIIGGAVTIIFAFFAIADYNPRADFAWNALHANSIIVGMTVPFRCILLCAVLVIAVSAIPLGERAAISSWFRKSWSGDREWRGWRAEMAGLFSEMLSGWAQILVRLLIRLLIVGAVLGVIILIGYARQGLLN